ncbi:MAG: radical SAM protein [Magnetococcales bacterium]|nr:radical SAM protein [Magnetococcales bacterium]
MKKILFIVPPHLSYDYYVNPPPNVTQFMKKDGKTYCNLFTDLPLGILSISAYLKKYARESIETRLLNYNIDLNDLEAFPYSNFADYFRDVLEGYREFKPDVIGLSALFTPSYGNMLEIAACCRAMFPQALIIAGGSVPSCMYKEVFRDSTHFDGLCFGEGEKPMLALMDAADPVSHLEGDHSWVTRSKLNSNTVFVHNFIEKLDEIPFYDYKLCDIGKYGLNTTYSQIVTIKDKISCITVMTSLGCPFKCAFCASHKVHGRKMRFYSLERLEEDFTRLRDEYGVETVVVMDDHVMGDRERAIEVSRLIQRLGMKPVFQGGLTLFSLDRKTLMALRETGVYQLNLSVESGSDRVLRHIMHKPLKLSIVEKVVANCRDLGIYTNVNILLGMPGETKRDIQEAKEYLKTIYANWFSIYSATPLVGSEMYDKCVENNYLTEGHLDSDYKKSVVETEDFSAQYIQDMAYIYNLELNFLYNSDYRLGDYKTALLGLEKTIRAKYDHMFAHYYTGKCYEFLGAGTKAEEHLLLARKIHDESPYWQSYAQKFNFTF